jgi:hypothetical protein
MQYSWWNSCNYRFINKLIIKHNLLYVRLHVSTFLNGHHEAFWQMESANAVYMLGSQYVYIDKIHENQHVSYLRISEICTV